MKRKTLIEPTSKTHVKITCKDCGLINTRLINKEDIYQCIFCNKTLSSKKSKF